MINPIYPIPLANKGNYWLSVFPFISPVRCVSAEFISTAHANTFRTIGTPIWSRIAYSPLGSIISSSIRFYRALPFASHFPPSTCVFFLSSAKLKKQRDLIKCGLWDARPRRSRGKGSDGMPGRCPKIEQKRIGIPAAWNRFQSHQEHKQADTLLSMNWINSKNPIWNPRAALLSSINYWRNRLNEIMLLFCGVFLSSANSAGRPYFPRSRDFVQME